MADAVWALGFMSGTALDGVDAALLCTDGAKITAFGPSLFEAYTAEQQAWLHKAVMRAVNMAEPDQKAFIAESRFLAESHLQAAQALLAQTGAEKPVVIGFHGQTVAHRPAQGWSWQIGDAAYLANRLNIPVVYDFRGQDVAAGGQGAPLAPFYHFALAKQLAMLSAQTEPLAFLNLGGVGNVTWVDPSCETPQESGALVAFDIGPANAVLNDWIYQRTGQPMDQDGALAAAGTVDAGRITDWLTKADYFQKPAPKSLDRNDFSWLMAAASRLSTEDGMAHLTAFVAQSVAAATQHFPKPVKHWFVCGGGRHNTTLMAAIAACLPDQTVMPVEAVGFNGDMLEAQAFAYLAVRSLFKMPLSAPLTTGVLAPISGGRILYPAS